MKRCAVLLPLFMGVLLVACQTPKKPEAPPPPKAHVLFEPGWSVSPIQMGEGRYPDLLAGACRGVWVDSTVTEMKRASAPPVDLVPPHLDEDARALTDAFIVIECHLVSEFGDMSVAYDTVRLRGIDVYLETPDGTRVRPIQSRSFVTVKEEPLGALKRFSLTTVVIFPRQDLVAGTPSISAAAPSARLVLEGHDSTCFFEWGALPAGQEGLRPPTPEEALYITKLGYYELYNGIRRLAHIVD